MTTDDVVEEIMRLHRSLPPRPGIDEVEAAKSLIRNVEREDQLRLDGIAKQGKGKDVPEELFKILQEIQRYMIHFQSKEQKKEALQLLDLEGAHLMFDDLIQRASRCVSGDSESIEASYNSSSSLSSMMNTTASTTPSSSSSFYTDKDSLKAPQALFSKDDTYVKKSKASSFHVDRMGVGIRSGDISTPPQIVDPTLKPVIASGEFNFFCFILVSCCLRVYLFHDYLFVVMEHLVYCRPRW